MENSPVVEVDFGIARVYVQGGEDESLEEVNEIADEKLESVTPMVERLKRMDHDLREEYSGEGESVPATVSSRTFD